MRSHHRVIPRDEALFRLSMLGAAACVGVMLVAVLNSPNVSRESALAVVAGVAIAACGLAMLAVERLLSTARRQSAQERAFSQAFHDLAAVDDAIAAEQVLCRSACELTGAAAAELTDADEADDPAVISVPLSHRGGKKFLHIRFPREPRNRRAVRDVALLLASIGARTLERTEFEAQAHEHAADLETVSEIARRLPGTSDAESARIAVCDGVLEVCGGALAVLMEPDGAGALIVSASAGAWAPPMRIPLDDESSVTVSSFRSGEPFFVSDISELPAVTRTRFEGIQAVSALWQPVIRDGTTTGVLIVMWDRPLARLSERAAAVVGLFAAEAAVVIERADLLARMEGLNRMLRVQVEALRMSDQLKTDFVSSVSHELRTPLASILGYLDLLVDGEVGELTAEQSDFLTVIDENARRLLVLINDLLTLSGLESGRMVLRAEPVDLRELVEARVREQEKLAESCGIGLSLALPTEAVEGTVDPDRLGQVVGNLLANAIKFTPAGGRVSVALGRSRIGIALSVSDTGIGISEDDQSRLFERFFRARNAVDHSIPGTGLGLAICKGIVDAHGGSLTVESALDEGTTVTVLLPTTPVTLSEPSLFDPIPAQGVV